MPNIGRVYKDSHMKDGKSFPLIQLDIRTISTRKKFTIAVNKMKYPDGNIKGVVAEGKENSPDFHIWANFSNRGESMPSVIVGSVHNAVSENGLEYKKGRLFDPFIQKESIYFTLFSVSEEKRIDENHLYDVVAEPYRKINNNTGDVYQAAQPSYDAPQQQGQREIPIEHQTIPKEIDGDEDEIPF